MGSSENRLERDKNVPPIDRRGFLTPHLSGFLIRKLIYEAVHSKISGEMDLIL